MIAHVFFDIGGVLGTDGWGRRQRAAAVERFGLDAEGFAARHAAAVDSWERGEVTMAQYLDRVVFDRPRTFARADMREFIFAQSQPNADTIALARGLAITRRFRLATVNNESAELHRYRVHEWGLHDIFPAFFASCWLGVTKPDRRIFETALAVCDADPARTVFIDDREQNLAAAQPLGMHTILFRDAAQLRQDLAALGVTS